MESAVITSRGDHLNVVSLSVFFKAVDHVGQTNVGLATVLTQ